MWIHRTLARPLAQAASTFPCVLVTGARQTGKTSLLRHVFPAAKYVSLDLPSAAAQAEENPETFLAGYGTPLIIDEIQYAPGLFRYLKIAIDADRQNMGRYLLTGSQKFSLMQGVSESLAGRCAVFELDTLSTTELRRTKGYVMPSVTQFLWRGAFPELQRNPDMSTHVFMASYVATYLERDVRQALRVSSLRDFERFLRACALRSGQLLNLTDLARDIGIASSTARDWLSVLEASNQVVLLEPYFNNAGKRLVKAPKIYMRDTGLLCFLCGLSSAEALDGAPFLGAVWETFVLGQLLRAKAANPAAAIWFWRDAHGTEVDFVVQMDGALRLVEAKWAETLTAGRALQPLLRVKETLGKHASAQHWVVCRTAHAHALAGHPDVRLVNGYTLDDWLS